MADIDFEGSDLLFVVDGPNDPIIRALKFIRNAAVLERLRSDSKAGGPTTKQVLAVLGGAKGFLDNEEGLLKLQQLGLLWYDYRKRANYDPGMTFRSSHEMYWMTTERGDNFLRIVEAGERAIRLGDVPGATANGQPSEFTTDAETRSRRNRGLW